MTAAVPARPSRLTILGAACFLCGATVGVKFDVVGDLYLLEILVAVLALQCVLARGLGKGFVAPLFLAFLAAGLITFCGYLLADLAAANEPWQYLKGWGRVAFLITDTAALMILAAHGRKNIWWLALGIGIGGIASLAIGGVPLTQWKLGYSEFAAIAVVALAPLCPPVLAAALMAAFGAGCMVADYRSLGAVVLATAAVMSWQRTSVRGLNSGTWFRIAVVLCLAAIAMAALLWSTQDEYAQRRKESNIGRYVGLVVGWRAIAESPVVGYGSWAADEKFGRMSRNELEKLDRDSRHPIVVTGSLLPHSQFLQAWIEGGVLGAAFFTMYGWYLLGGLRWFAIQRPRDKISPLFLFFILGGLWNLLASPFLGIHRMNIAIAVAAIAVAAHERRIMPKTTAMRGANLAERTSGAAPQ